MESRTKRIARNTLFLYIRTFVAMVIGIFTGRIMLEALGIDNYGINNVVGGIVSFASVITGTMAVSSSRYLSYALGEGNFSRLKTIFSTIVNVHFLIGLISIIFLEIIGVWFLNTTAEIPSGRMFAANCVLQFSILTMFVGIMTIPLNALIIARERMTIFAYMSILDSLAKLGLCYIIISYNGDRLILYSFCLFLISFINPVTYIIYCRNRFEEASYQRRIDKSLIKELVSFSGWNFIDNTTWVFNSQGINMLINVFYGVAYNATRGICVTVSGCVVAFMSTFTSSMTPQITKSYATKDFAYCFSLVNRGSKISWYLMLFFLVPVYIEAETLLRLWLVEVPPMAVIFLRLTLFESLAIKSGITLQALLNANGNIKRYTTQAAIYTSLIFCLTGLLYYIGAPVWSTYIISIFIFFTLNAIRVTNISKLMPYNWRTYISEVMCPCLLVTALSFILPLTITEFWSPSIQRFLVMIPLCIISTIFVEYFFGLTKSEKTFIKNKVFEFTHKNRRSASLSKDNIQR